MKIVSDELIDNIYTQLVQVISETNAISLMDTLELWTYSDELKQNPSIQKIANEFVKLLSNFQQDEVDINTLLGHPVSHALAKFFKNFPINYYEDHIHLTGSLNAEFIYPRLKKLLNGKNKELYEEKIKEVYGKSSIPINSVEDVDKLIKLNDDEQFDQYLKILYLAKLVLTNKKAHEEASYHMAKELYTKYNVGHIRLKFTFSRSSNLKTEQIPGLDNITGEDVVLGLYKGFKKFHEEFPDFGFILSPSFRKEPGFFDSENYESKKDHFVSQVTEILDLIAKYPELKDHLKEVDTVGDEKELFRKKHFAEMKEGFRRLQYNGFKIRSHHGETWRILRKGIQSVDNAMNIWHIDNLEHGISLGINPNYYFHRIFQKVVEKNSHGESIAKSSLEYRELADMNWYDESLKEKLLNGVKITRKEETEFLKIKFHTAREIEHYQHDVLNRLIDKEVSLVALPSSNMKLTGSFPDYKDHPFSWWEKKGVKLGVGTDNYITLNTNYIQEMLILLYSDPSNLKITKLLMVTTKEKRRPYISHLLWKMRKKIV